MWSRWGSRCRAGPTRGPRRDQEREERGQTLKNNKRKSRKRTNEPRNRTTSLAPFFLVALAVCILSFLPLPPNDCVESSSGRILIEIAVCLLESKFQVHIHTYMHAPWLEIQTI